MSMLLHIFVLSANYFFTLVSHEYPTFYLFAPCCSCIPNSRSVSFRVPLPCHFSVLCLLYRTMSWRHPKINLSVRCGWAMLSPT